MKHKTLLGIGAGGFTLTAICCVTPVLGLLLGAAGLSALAAYLDYLLLPALVLFAGVTVYAAYHLRQQRACCAVEEEGASGAASSPASFSPQNREPLP